MKTLKTLIILSFLAALITLTASCKKEDDKPQQIVYGSVTDIDGNIYKTVKIGTAWWMAENLKVTHYRNGESISNVTDYAEWIQLNTGAYCVYSNALNNNMIYGKLYNWHAVNDSRNLAPTGWHVPSDDEWTNLEIFLIANGYNYDSITYDNKLGKAMADKINWVSSTVTGAVGNTDYPAKMNASGFKGEPGGGRVLQLDFFGLGEIGFWWSSTGYTADDAFFRNLIYDGAYFARGNLLRIDGLSVRCVKE